MLLWALLAMVATIALFPEIRVAQFLRRVLINGPAEWLNSSSPRRAWLSVATSIMLLALLPLMIQVALPYELALLMAGDLVVYMEALTMVSLLAAQGRLRTLAGTIAHSISRLMRPRAPRSRSTAPRRAGRKDADDEGPGLAFA